MQNENKKINMLIIQEINQKFSAEIRSILHAIFGLDEMEIVGMFHQLEKSRRERIRLAMPNRAYPPKFLRKLRSYLAHNGIKATLYFSSAGNRKSASHWFLYKSMSEIEEIVNNYQTKLAGS